MGSLKKSANLGFQLNIGITGKILFNLIENTKLDTTARFTQKTKFHLICSAKVVSFALPFS